MGGGAGGVTCQFHSRVVMTCIGVKCGSPCPVSHPCDVDLYRGQVGVTVSSLVPLSLSRGLSM